MLSSVLATIDIVDHVFAFGEPYKADAKLTLYGLDVTNVCFAIFALALLIGGLVNQPGNLRIFTVNLKKLFHAHACWADEIEVPFVMLIFGKAQVLP